MALLWDLMVVAFEGDPQRIVAALIRMPWIGRQSRERSTSAPTTLCGPNGLPSTQSGLRTYASDVCRSSPSRQHPSARDYPATRDHPKGAKRPLGSASRCPPMVPASGCENPKTSNGGAQTGPQSRRGFPRAVVGPRASGHWRVTTVSSGQSKPQLGSRFRWNGSHHAVYGMQEVIS